MAGSHADHKAAYQEFLAQGTASTNATTGQYPALTA